ncbi:MAG: Outer rane receptor protein [Gemmatimonadetes bacterium]|jgi:iron complex outermembrane receptor protein|nr:Outer rane receptor protein [Gemmatimonadota bacterium]
MPRLALATAVLLAAGPVAAAQDTTRAQPLPALSVTATRTAVSVLDVPLAVTVVGADQLRARRGVGLDEALSLVPGVFAQSRSGGSDVRLTIRGFGARGAGDRSNAGTTRGVRVLIDGIPETEPDGRTALDLVDLALVEQLEVVRSNASALYGNAAGGVVGLRSMPLSGSPAASVQGQVGSFGLRRLIGRASMRAGSATTWAGVASTHLAGWRAHAQSDRTTVLAGIAAPLGQRTSLAVLLAAGNDRFQIPGPLTLAEAEATPRAANATYASRDERRYNRIVRLGTTLEHAIDSSHALSAMLFVTPKVLQRSERGTFRDFTRYHLGGNLVYRASHPVTEGIDGQLLVGADEAYQDGAILFYTLSATGMRGTTLRDNRGEGAGNTGVFVEERLAVGDRLLVSLAARRDAIRYDYRNHITPQTNASRTFSQVTPKIGVTWKLSPTHSLYANVGGGVEAPAGNETDPASTFGQDTVTALNPLLEPIRSTTWEVGMKRLLAFGPGTPLLRSASYDLALYDTEVRNEIVPYRGGRFYFTAGEVRRQGAEGGLTVEAAGGVRLRGALTLNRHRYTDYVVDSVHYGAPGRFASHAGNRVVGVPDVHFGGSIGTVPALLPAVRLEAGVTGAGAYYADDANQVRVPGYTLLNATILLREPLRLGGVVAGRGFVSVNNLANRRYIASAFLNPDVVNGVPVAFEPGSPRELVVGLTLEAH